MEQQNKQEIGLRRSFLTWLMYWHFGENNFLNFRTKANYHFISLLHTCQFTENLYLSRTFNRFTSNDVLTTVLKILRNVLAIVHLPLRKYPKIYSFNLKNYVLLLRIPVCRKLIVTQCIETFLHKIYFLLARFENIYFTENYFEANLKMSYKFSNLFFLLQIISSMLPNMPLGEYLQMFYWKKTKKEH